MSVFDKIRKGIGEMDLMKDKLSLMTKGINVRVTVTQGDYSRRFWVLVDRLDERDKQALDMLLAHLAEFAEDDSEEITIQITKDGKKVEE